MDGWVQPRMMTLWTTDDDDDAGAWIDDREQEPIPPPPLALHFIPTYSYSHLHLSLFLHLPCFVLALALLLSGPRCHTSVPDHLLHPSPSTRLSIRFWSLHLFLSSRLASPYPKPDRQKFVVLAIPSTFCHLPSFSLRLCCRYSAYIRPGPRLFGGFGITFVFPPAMHRPYSAPFPLSACPLPLCRFRRCDAHTPPFFLLIHT